MSFSEYWEERLIAPSKVVSYKWRRIWERITPHYFLRLEVRELVTESDAERFALELKGKLSTKPLMRDGWSTTKSVSSTYLAYRYRDFPPFQSLSEESPCLYIHSETIGEAHIQAMHWMRHIEDDFFAKDGTSLMDVRSHYSKEGISLRGVSSQRTWGEMYEAARDFEEKAERSGEDSCFTYIQNKSYEFAVCTIGRNQWKVNGRVYTIRNKEDFKRMITVNMGKMMSFSR